MNQSPLGSLIESAMNVAIGLAISLVANAIVFPQFGFSPTAAENVAISTIYTVISLVRSSLLRRFFNARLRETAERMARATA